MSHAKALNRREFLERSAIAGVSLLVSPDVAFPADRATALGPRTAVRRHRGRSMFFLDGQPYTKPVVETYVPKTRFFRQFAEAGTEVFSFSTDLGPGFGTPVWPGANQRTFRDLSTGMAVIDWHLFYNDLWVLRHGGRLLIADLVTAGELPEEVRQSAAAWADCLAGALEKEVYLETIRQAGFAQVEVVSGKSYEYPGMEAGLRGKILSVQVRGIKAPGAKV